MTNGLCAHSSVSLMIIYINTKITSCGRINSPPLEYIHYPTCIFNRCSRLRLRRCKCYKHFVKGKGPFLSVIWCLKYTYIYVYIYIFLCQHIIVCRNPWFPKNVFIIGKPLYKLARQKLENYSLFASHNLFLQEIILHGHKMCWQVVMI